MEETVPSNFRPLIQDMTRDLSITYPEYSYLWDSWTKDDVSELTINGLYQYCTTVYPERFFDILYQNDEIFDIENKTNTLFLPGVEFKLLFNCDDITHKTRKSLWKYLQLVLFMIVKNVKDKSKFGDSMNLFDNMENIDLYEKINEAIEGMSDFFQDSVDEANNSSSEPLDENMDLDGLKEVVEELGRTFEEAADVHTRKEEADRAEGRPDLNTNTTFRFDEDDKPDAAKLHDHIKNLFNGKIGTLAQELAEEISQDIQNILGDLGEIKSIHDLIKHALKNPDKIIAIVKRVSDRLQEKLSSGEISQEDLLKEVGDIVGNMKKMDNMKGIFESVGAATEGSTNISDVIQNLLGAINGPGGMGSKGMGNLLRIIKKFMASMSKGNGGANTMMSMMKKFMGEDGARQMEEFQTMFENMPDEMKGPRTVYADPNALERETAKTSLKDRMKNRIMMKKLKEAEQLAKEEADKAERAKNYVPYDFALEDTVSKNKVFRIEGETQETSSLPPATVGGGGDKKKKKKKGKK